LNVRKFASVREDWLLCRLLVCICAALLSLKIISVDRVQAAGSGLVTFDLSPQPLSEALEAYSTATGRPVLYDGRLTLGRVSAEVKGTFAPDAALQLLLKSTGLVARYTAQDAFIIAPAPIETARRTPSAIAYAALSGRDIRERNYYGLVQASIGTALCSSSQTMPGHYRLALQLWIDRFGNVVHPKLLASTGNEERDRAIIDIVGHASIAQAPPATLSQPFTMVALRGSSSERFDCPSSKGYGRNG
jgi:hypothetical protein